MKAHSVVLLRAGIGWETCEDAERTLRLPVLAFYTMDTADSGNGTCDDIAPDERELMSRTISDLYSMVAMPAPPKDPVVFARERIAEVRRVLKRRRRCVPEHRVTLSS
jgi:hypothetical protein